MRFPLPISAGRFSRSYSFAPPTLVIKDSGHNVVSFTTLIVIFTPHLPIRSFKDYTINNSETTEPDIIPDHPDWQEGDFTLISSDGWRFRVSSEALLASR